LKAFERVSQSHDRAEAATSSNAIIIWPFLSGNILQRIPDIYLAFACALREAACHDEKRDYFGVFPGRQDHPNADVNFQNESQLFIFVGNKHLVPSFAF
jgi:hypothetical protein